MIQNNKSSSLFGEAFKINSVPVLFGADKVLDVIVVHDLFFE
jgi:hypothetical protein